jgi:hypothetical protein
MVKPTVHFSFMTMLQHRGRFYQGFLSKEQYDKTGTYPWLAPADCSLFLRLQSGLKGRRFRGAIDINNATEELKTGFTKLLPGMFPTPLQSLAEVCKGTILNEM